MTYQQILNKRKETRRLPLVENDLLSQTEQLISPSCFMEFRCQILCLLCVVYISSLSAISYNIGYHWDRTGNDENGYLSAYV